MKKIFILVLMVLVGIGLVLSNIRADEARTIKHSFRGFTTATEGVASMTIFRITGFATGSNAKYAIYNSATLENASNSTVAIESGEATSGDPLLPIDFGDDGITLPTGMTIDITSCNVVIEYI